MSEQTQINLEEYLNGQEFHELCMDYRGAQSGHANDCYILLQDSIRAQFAAAQARIKELEKDAARFQYLQNIPVKDAQAFFWNYASRKQRAAAIDSAMVQK